MSKMSNLDLVLDEMITAGQKMIDAATALKEMFSDIAPAVRKIDTKTEKKEAPAPAPEVKKYSFQEVRGIMACPALDVIKTPLRDGDKERPGDEAYKDSYFINANSATALGIVDADRQQIIDRSEVYSGVYGRASINLYAFNSNGNRGIACGLNNLQKIRDGEPLGGKSRAEDDFATEEDDDFLS